MTFTKEIRKKIEAVARAHNLTLVVFFGSQATEKTHRGSDVDIAYAARTPLHLEEEARLLIDLAAICKTNQIDLVSLREASPLLLREVANTGKALYEADSSSFHNFYLYAIRRFAESRQLQKLRSRYLIKRIAHYAA